MSKWNDVLEKAHKIRELRDRASTPEEAATAAAKLQELLIKHQIDEYALDGHKPNVKHPVVAVEFDVNEGMVKGRRISKGWRWTVGHTAAEAHGCKSVHWHTTSRMTIVGYQTNVDAAIHLFHYLKEIIIDLTLAGYKAHQAEEAAHWREPSSPRKWHQSFADGAIWTIRTRLRTARQQAEEHTAESSMALVVMNEAVEQKYGEMFPNLSRNKGRAIRDINAYRNGVAAGRTVSLDKPINGGSKPKSLR